MLTVASSSVAPLVAAWIGSLAAPLMSFFSANAGPTAQQRVVVNTVQALTPPRTDRSFALAMQDHSVGQASACAYPEADAPTSATYWPCERLNAFILQMAAHGHCVSAAMMLGHRHYAMQQLAAAQQLSDEVLRGLAAELQAYFDVTPDTAVQRLAAEQS